MGGKLMKRAFAMFLAASVILTQQSITGYGLSVVRAEDSAAQAEGSWVATSYVTNGDFETGDTTGWTVTTNATVTVEANEWAANKTNKFMNIWVESAGSGTAVSVSHSVSLPAGKYYVSLQNAGDARASSLSLNINGTTKALSAMTGWDTWGTTTSEQFELSEAATMNLEISGTVTTSGYYEKLDNIVIYQWQDAPEYTLDDLTTLIANVPSDYASMGFTADSTAALNSALAAANACTAETDANTVSDAYEALSTALDGLVFDGTVFVKKISNYDTDSIRGVDVSSYLSLMDAFAEVNKNITDESKKVGFRDWDGNLLDEQGFFNLLAESGVNYVRLRVWNNPYNSSTGIGYGGGNNDLAKAITMGQYATNAGMKVLIDFHFSDFWADPGKQKAPKDWASYTVDQKATAVSEYVTSSLNALKTAKVNVGMVQIGNETTAGIAGVTGFANMDKLFDAGCDAVHNFNTVNGTNILAALHFTNPEKGTYPTIAANLANYDGDGDGTAEGVSYDVFASSYYPYWHGTMANLTSALNTIATTYDKYVMVAETSWATTYEDGDGHGNTIDEAADLGSSVSYSVSVQGQANEFRDVVEAVNNVSTLKNGDKAGLGAFYWEPAWIPVQYAYNEDGTLNEDIYASNQALWEKYGAGWASSSATEYDPDDAGAWYGGSAVDNQAMFDFNGNPLNSLNMFKYLAYGATATLAIDSYTAGSVQVEVGTTVTSDLLPSSISVIYNDSTTAALPVTWNSDDLASVSAKAATNSGIGTHTVNGTVTLADSSTYPVTCTVTVVAKNLLTNYSFENSSTGWTISGTGASVKKQNAKTGSYSTDFYRATAFAFTVSQTITVAESGIYTGYMYIEGGSGTGGNSGESIYLSATTSGGGEYKSDSVTLTGYNNWQKPMVYGIKANAGDTITLTMYVTAAAGAWGSIDDACLYMNKAATSISFASHELALSYGDSATLKYTTDQDTPPLPALTSSDTTVATVDSTGKVTAVGVGTATITVATIDSTDLTDTCEVTVTPKDLSKASNITVSLDTSSYDYDESTKTPGVTVTDGSTALTQDTDYTVAYSKNLDAGTAVVTIEGIGKYQGTLTKEFIINAKDINNTTITIPSSVVYSGTAQTPVTITDGNTTLVKDKDYTVDYGNYNTNAGTVTVTINGINNYTGTVTKTFDITAKDISNASVTLASSVVYNGKAQTPAVTVKDGSKTLNKGTDYTVDYGTKNTNAGTVTVTIKGTNNYTGTITKTFNITQATKKITVKSTSITKAYGDKAFSLGASATGDKTLKYVSSNTKIVKIDSNGKVTIVGYGKATITVSSLASTNYKAATRQKVTITVAPKANSIKSAASKKAGQITVSYGKSSSASGYIITYSTSKSFTNAKTATVTSAKTTSKTITGLSKGKTYYVKITPYKTVSGKKIYGNYSAVKTVKVKK